MADLRRRKPDDDSGKHVDDENFPSSKPERCSGDGANGSDDEQLLHHKKPSSGLTTADSSDHVNINIHSLKQLFFHVFFYISVYFIFHSIIGLSKSKI